MIKTAFWRTLQKEIFDKSIDENENEDTFNPQSSPIIRIHPPEQTTPQRSPSLNRWSPAITRNNKDNDIPFELPLLSPRRSPEPQSPTFQIQPENTNPFDSRRNRSVSLAVFNHPSSHFLSVRKSNPTVSGKRSDISDEYLLVIVGYARKCILCYGRQYKNENGNKVKSHQRSASVDVLELNKRNSALVDSNWLGKIEPELYKTPAECTSRCGRIWFSLVYDGAIESLMVKVIKIEELPPRTKGETPRDSFVKVFLLPNEKLSHQTKVRHRSNNPIFNETFNFQVSNSEIRQRILRLSVYDEEKRKSSRNLLGHALVHLDDLDFSKASDEMWTDLDDIAKPGDTGSTLGDLLISLSYIPNAERLSVVVKEAKNLRRIDLDGTGVYVKVAFYLGNKLIKSKKTSTKVGVSDPKYNESFHYKITAEDMEQTSVVFTVVTRAGYGAINRLTASVKSTLTGGRYGVENKYGKVIMGSNSRADPSMHWQEILSLSHHQAPKSITKWHPLSEIVDNS